MKVLVAHSLPPVTGADRRISGEFDLHEAAEAVVSVLPGAVSRGIEGRDEEFADLARNLRPDVVFNLYAPEEIEER